MKSYEEIKALCLERKVLWEDPDFPATQTSVFYHQTPPFSFEWKRPTVRNHLTCLTHFLMDMVALQEFVISPAFLSNDCQIIPGKLGM